MTARSEIERTVTILSEMEKELDDLKLEVEDMKRKLIARVKEEAEKARDEAIIEIQTKAQAELEKARQEAEEEARKIITQTRGEMEQLKAKIDRLFDRAVDTVAKETLKVSE